LRHQAHQTLFQGIVPFWLQYSVDLVGGFYGQLSRTGRPVPGAPKGLVLHSRILWTFAAIYQVVPDLAYRRMAERAYTDLTTRFYDPTHGGYFWLLDATGHPLERKYEVYGLAFVIYALAEYAQATQSESARHQAIQLFSVIQTHCHDPIHGGYRESFQSDWHPQPVSTMAHGVEQGVKTMNTHLHLLEAYTALYRLHPEPDLRAALQALLDLFRTVILDSQCPTCRLIFTADWQVRRDTPSLGHDIEASWLLCAAAEALADPVQITAVQALAVDIAAAVLRSGFTAQGGLVETGNPGQSPQAPLTWWPQAEALVGLLNAWQMTQNRVFLDGVARSWVFIQRYLVDHRWGEWHSRPAGRPAGPKVSPWKGPYHNSRACLELLRRIA
ncbi:MAG: AGE family epimerase/isomerase, partial [Gloeomargaritaceae cyanobacterium C42_A2020_066]|nr:AGE family epimerase/isomerase [Gloeomargaritaceae cyanobacterium C42_A2020_066]